MTRFVLATGFMAVLLGLGLLWGGLWAALALGYITLVSCLLDRLSVLAAPDRPAADFPAGTGLSVALGLAQFPLLYGGIWVLAEGGLPLGERVMLFLALGLFLGQLGNANAHELIHRPQPWLRVLGKACYISVLYGHHVSAHLRVHHVFAATARDPNSAPLGQGFYRFLGRAWWGELVAGYHAERRAGRVWWRHPYLFYAAGAGLSLALAYGLAGGAGLWRLLALACYAQLQLLLSDYVQHYGLRRRETGPGQFERVGPQHSWNSPHGFSSALMLNAPRHSDHHLQAAKPYPGLALDRGSMPVLPYGLPVMATLALLPPLWHRVMDPRVRNWAAGR